MPHAHLFFSYQNVTTGTCFVCQEVLIDTHTNCQGHCIVHNSSLRMTFVESFKSLWINIAGEVSCIAGTSWSCSMCRQCPCLRYSGSTLPIVVVSSSLGIRHRSPYMRSDMATYRSYLKDARVPRKYLKCYSIPLLHSTLWLPSASTLSVPQGHCGQDSCMQRIFAKGRKS
jgi:hypothetical protein